LRNLTGYCWIIVGLWGVINNAGLCVFAECEWCPLDIYQQLIDVNLTGLIRVTKAFVPLIRSEDFTYHIVEEPKRSKYLIVEKTKTTTATENT
jgi:NAD(P)-dependent dehydrogenase (short-subunit alcohol dehydrogenase family)